MDAFPTRAGIVGLPDANVVGVYHGVDRVGAGGSNLEPSEEPVYPVPAQPKRCPKAEAWVFFVPMWRRLNWRKWPRNTNM